MFRHLTNYFPYTASACYLVEESTIAAVNTSSANMSANTTLDIDDATLKNIKDIDYKLLYHPLDGRITSVTTLGNVAFVGLANDGCHVFR